MIEANSASSSAYEVSMITFVSGRASRIARHASTPEPSGRRTSMITTSGLARAAASIDSATLPASPTTLIPAWRLIKPRSPSRTTSWSSQISTRVVVVMPRLPSI